MQCVLILEPLAKSITTTVSWREEVDKTRIMYAYIYSIILLVRRGRGGKEKEWTDCVQSDIRAFGITGGLENDGGKG